MASHSTAQAQAEWRAKNIDKARAMARDHMRRKRAAARAAAGQPENPRREPMFVRLNRRLRSLTIRKEMLQAPDLPEYDGWARDVSENNQAIADCLATIREVGDLNAAA